MISIAAALAMNLVAAPQVTLFGDVITSWSDFGSGEYVNTAGEGMSFDQADLGIHTRFSDWTEGYARVTMAGTSSSLSEAYFRLSGLPWQGSLTIGRFYKPLGAPIPTASLSFAALLLHGSPEYGLKLNLSRGRIDLEAGVTNGNILLPAAQSSAIGGSPAPTTGDPGIGADLNNNKDYYGRIAYVRGEDWGSLTAGVTYTGGRLSTAEQTMLSPRAAAAQRLFRSLDFSTQRHHLSFDLDFQKGPWRLFVEYAHAQDGRAIRKILSTAGSYTFYPAWGAFTTTLGFDKLNHNAEIRTLAVPLSWERERTSLALTWQPHEILQWQAEYDWNREDVRETSGRKVDNNGVTIQTILYF